MFEPSERTRRSPHGVVDQPYLNIELRKEEPRSRRLNLYPSTAWPKPNVKNELGHVLRRNRSGCAYFAVTLQGRIFTRTLTSFQKNAPSPVAGCGWWRRLSESRLTFRRRNPHTSFERPEQSRFFIEYDPSSPAITIHDATNFRPCWSINSCLSPGFFPARGLWVSLPLATM